MTGAKRAGHHPPQPSKGRGSDRALLPRLLRSHAWPVFPTTLCTCDRCQGVQRSTWIGMWVHSATSLGPDTAPLAYQQSAAEQIRPHLHSVITPLVQFWPDTAQRCALREQRELHRLRLLTVRATLCHRLSLATCGTLPSPVIAETCNGYTKSRATVGHSCFVCGVFAAFGFNTRTGDVWTCSDHRAEGDQLLVAPAASTRRASLGRAVGVGR